MKRQAWAGIVAGTLLAGGPAAPAMAQQVLHSPDEIKSCLCEEQSVTALADEVLRQNRTYEERRKALETLDNEVKTRRAAVNVQDQTAVDAFKQLLDRRDEAADSFAGPVTKNYADTVARYNQAVAGFNASCAGKAYDPEVLAQVRSNLICPKP